MTTNRKQELADVLAAGNDLLALTTTAADCKFLHQLAVFDIPRTPQLRKAIGNRHLLEQLRSMLGRHDTGAAASNLLNAYQAVYLGDRDHWTSADGEDPQLTAEARTELEVLLDADFSKRGPTPSNLVARGSIHHIDHEIEACERAFKQATECASKEDDLRVYQYGAYTYLAPTPENFAAVEDVQIPTGEIVVQDKVNPPKGPVIVSAMDAAYFQKYAGNLAASLSVFPGNALHFHVINPDSDTLSQYEGLKRDLPDLSLGLSTEQSAHTFKAYYATCRFIRAAELLHAIGHDICIHDADIAFGEAPSKLYEGWDKYDAGFLRRFRFPSHVPWRTVTAQAVHLSNSREGFYCATAVSATCRYMFDQNLNKRTRDRLWWIDQNALYFAYEYIKQKGFAVHHIEPSILRHINHTLAYKASMKS